MSNEQLTPGYYICEILEPQQGWFGESSKGSLYVRLPMRVNSPTVQATLVWKGYISSEASEARTIRQMREALNVPNNWFELLTQNDQFLVGEKVSVKVEAEVGTDGKTRMVPTWINNINKAGQESSGPAVAKSKLESLSRRMAAMTKAVAAESGSTVAPTVAPTVAHTPGRTVRASDPIVDDLADDDIPF